MIDTPETSGLGDRQDSDSGSDSRATPGSPATEKPFAISYAAISLVWIVLAAWPLITGSETLFLRDVFNTHLVLRHGAIATGTTGLATGTESIAAVSQFPPALIDPARGGGQPLAGNPNALPFYPTSLLSKFTPTLWALNAHFWIHWLLAPFAMFWMARRFGLSPPGAWAAAVAYGSSGFLISTLNLYNVIAVAALAPALIAAALASIQEERPGWRLGALGLLWALILTAGDPASAALALLAALGAMMLCGFKIESEGRDAGLLGRLRRLIQPALAITLGTVAALPQLVEFWRILPTSFRGVVGYAGRSATTGSLHPTQWLEWWLPGLFGRIDRLGPERFWAQSLFDGALPIFFSVSPGLIVLALVLIARRTQTGPARRTWFWAWSAIGIGVFFALGSFNPVAAWIFDLPGAGAFRYPSKFWLLAALAFPVLAGLGFARLARPNSAEGTSPTGLAEEPGGRRSATWQFSMVLAGIAGFGIVLALIGWLSADRLAHWLGVPVSARDFFADRWTHSALLSIGLLLAAGLTTFFLRSRPQFRHTVLMLLLFFQTATQLDFLSSLLATDSTAAYRSSPSLTAMIEPGDRIAQADLFGSQGRNDPAGLLRPAARYLAQRGHLRLDAFAGLGEGYHYDLQISPEGLDSFLARVARDVVRQARTDGERFRLLKIWGFDWAVLDRPLVVEPGQAEERDRCCGYGRDAVLFEVLDPLPEVYWVDRAVSEPDIGAAVRRLSDPGFDPKTTVLLAGDSSELTLDSEADGTARWRIVDQTPEILEVEVEAASSGVLVVQRAWLPLWQATVDGQAAAVEAANLYRMGVRVPAGRHTVRLSIDRGPYRIALVFGLLGLFGLLGWTLFGAFRGVGRRRPSGDDLGRAEPVEVEAATENV